VVLTPALNLPLSVTNHTHTAAIIETALQEMGVTLAKGNGRVLGAPFTGRTSQWLRVSEGVASAGG
jgi:hypothetical protein